jgi:fumarate hydratase, class II
MQYRVEQDIMGAVQVPAEQLWGAQTERSRRFFHIGDEKMPFAADLQSGPPEKGLRPGKPSVWHAVQVIKDLIVQVCDEILTGQHDQEFPLSVWQTGSGTQTNMNVNEVIANRAAVLATG